MKELTFDLCSIDSYTLADIPDFQALLREAEKNYPAVDAFRFRSGETLCARTYPAFAADVRAFASRLIGQGFSRSHIALLSENSYAWIVAYYAILVSGNVVMPIDRMLPTTDICSILRMGEAEAVFLGAQEQARQPELADGDAPTLQYLALEDDWFAPTEQAPQLPQLDGKKTAAILFTSGTTGMSKGVMLTQHNLLSNAFDTIRTTGIERCYHRTDGQGNPINRFLHVSILPYHHIFETSNIIRNLIAGTTICIAANVRAVGESLQLYRPHCINVVPAIADYMMVQLRRKMAEANLTDEMLSVPAVRQRLLEGLGGNLFVMGIGGAKTSPATHAFFEKLGITLQEGYGMTECAPVITAQPKKDYPADCCGKVIEHVKVRIVDGEIRVKGPNVMQGYYKNEQATKEAFDADGFLRTGDIGALDENGFIQILGRLKNVIILPSGKNIYPEEYEQKLSRRIRMREIVVYEADNQITAEILPLDQNEATQEAIRAEIVRFNQELPPYMRVTNVRFRDREFVKTTTGKIKRNLLQTERTAAAFHAPETETERKICAVFATLLQKPAVSRDANFFTLGGDSLFAVEAAAQLDIAPQLLYANPTAAELAARMEEQRQHAQTVAAENEAAINQLIAASAPAISAQAPKRILLTGATGFLGAHILRELLDRPCTVYCLVRDEAKFRKVLAYYFGEINTDKIRVLIGDIEQAQLGLTQEGYDHLAQKVDTVIHVAANVHHAGDYKVLRRTNYTGTKYVTAFAKQAGAVLHHTSTASLSGSGTTAQTQPEPVFDEFTLNIGQSFRDNVYIHSKYRAEECVLRARQEGLLVNIYRIGNLTWRSSDGKFQINSDDNGFIGRIRALCKLNAVTEELNRYPIDFTPVDECAKAFVTLVFSNHLNEIYHLYNPHILSVADVLKLMAAPYHCIEREEWVKRLQAKQDDKDIRVLSFYSKISSRSDFVLTKNDFTVQRLRELHFTWGAPNRRYLCSYLDSRVG